MSAPEGFQIYIDSKQTDFDKSMYDIMDITDCGFSLLDDKEHRDVFNHRKSILFINKIQRQLKFISCSMELELIYVDCLLDVLHLVYHKEDDDMYDHHSNTNDNLSTYLYTPPLFCVGKGRIVDLIENLLNDSINIENFFNAANRYLSELRNAISELASMF